MSVEIDIAPAYHKVLHYRNHHITTKNSATSIALSQSNPLEAVAEFVENSIDVRAKHITLVRGKEHGVHFLRIKNDGEGIRRSCPPSETVR
ncbi:MAG TPA: hypothetical protein PLY00_15990 [Verrucomicrobiota bacterium]|nr:hypothetical protein [Verrucomicrobiota bacterium]HOA62459.1 hypothetical protein [Verrucomicrobiota bacterium]HOF49720.1 hypothetical protein [Verrucomicrobiota bacterium]HOR72762.1 hypothetical protein [Verrucomicrobiota bacterium]HOU89129.1 hypothetical protein [Verrucomicrobiota bacterium]